MIAGVFNNKKITVVIPCHNEEKGIGKTLADIPSYVDEIIVVDNASSDNTADIAGRSGAKVVYEGNKGYGNAYRAGLAAVTGNIVVTMDGDGTYPAQEIERLLRHMEQEQCDFISGCRYPLSDKKAQPFMNVFVNFLQSLLIGVLFRIWIRDSQSGMMLFKKPLLDKILSTHPGMGFSQELKIKAFLDPDTACAELHIPYFARMGKVKFRKFNDSFQNVLSVLALWRNPSALGG